MNITAPFIARPVATTLLMVALRVQLPRDGQHLGRQVDERQRPARFQVRGHVPAAAAEVMAAEVIPDAAAAAAEASTR